MSDLFKWKRALDNSLNATLLDTPEFSDTDHPTCPQCGSTMNFIGHNENGEELPLGEAYWLCPICNLKVREKDL